MRESAPGVFQDVAFKQDALSILQFKEVLDDESIAIGAAYVARLPWAPTLGLEHVIMSNLDVPWTQVGCPAPKQDVLRRGFQEVIQDLIRSHGKVPNPAQDGLRIRAGTSDGDAVKIGEERINHSYVGASAQCDSTGGFVLGGTVHPDTIEDDVVGRTAILHMSQAVYDLTAQGTGDLQSQ